MKFLFPIILAPLFAALAGAAEMRSFTSADGSKTLKAKVLDVSAAKQTARILRSDGKSMTIPLKALSNNDQAYLKEWYQSSMAGRRLAIRISDEEVKTGESKANNGRVTAYDSRFKLNVRNNGNNAFENIEVKYCIFYTIDGVDGAKNQDLVSNGQANISSIAPRTDQDITTSTVKLTKVRPLPASQCVGGT
ncbi:MAG: hypothetical protein MK183_06460 [Verrucomicrobiales bacterium]|nr:hypothetical protein [Verrucomicrobiales bacterium]